MSDEPRDRGDEQERLDEEERREAARRVRELPLTEAQRALVLSALKRVQKTANLLGVRWSSLLSMGELLSAGHLGVVRVTQTYNPSMGSFGPYAANRVLGAMMDALRKESRHRHHYRAYTQACEFLSGQVDPAQPMHDSDEMTRGHLRAFSDELITSSLSGALDELSNASGEWVIAERQAYAKVLAAQAEERAKLPEHEQLFLRLLFDEGWTLKDVAQELGMSYATARRRQGEILVKLSAGMRARGIRNAWGGDEESATAGRHEVRESSKVRQIRRRSRGG